MNKTLDLRPKQKTNIVVVEKVVVKKRSWKVESVRMLSILVLVSALGWGISQAGSLIPPAGTPSKTMYTLDDIYTLVTTGTTTASTDFTTPGSATPTFHTLEDIVRDYKAPSTGKPDLNTFGPFVADGQADNGWLDQNTGLIWENTDSGQYLCWDGNQGCDGPLQATEYCQYLDADGVTVDNDPQNLWRLPSVKEWQSVLDYSASTFSTYNVATALPNTQGNFYWSSTEYAPYTSYAWLVSTGDGYVGYSYEGSYGLVRCVR